MLSGLGFNEILSLHLLKVHERTDEMDFLLLILRKLLQSNSPYVKVISKQNKSLLSTVSSTSAVLSMFFPPDHPDVRSH